MTQLEGSPFAAYQTPLPLLTQQLGMHKRQLSNQNSWLKVMGLQLGEYFKSCKNAWTGEKRVHILKKITEFLKSIKIQYEIDHWHANSWVNVQL